MRAPALRDLQAAFWRALQGGGAPDAELLAVVRPTRALSPAARVGIYAEMYVARLVDALREDFPKLAAAVDAERFATLARDYVTAHPSVGPSIRDVGAAFPAFVATREAGWLADLARLEWARRDVFDAADATPLTAADLYDVPAEAWPDLRFRLVPAVARLVVGWPVHALWSGASGPLPPERTALRIWRQGFAVYQTAMDALEEAALDRVAAGDPFSAVCEPFEEPADAAALLLRWVEDGIVARLADPAPGLRS